MGAIGDAARALGIRHLLAEIRPEDRGLEGALELLGILLRRHVPARGVQFGAGHNPRLARPQRHRQPIWVHRATLVQCVECVVALRRANERRAALAVSQERADYLAPYRRMHVRRLIHHDAVEIQPAQAVGVVGAV